MSSFRAAKRLGTSLLKASFQPKHQSKYQSRYQSTTPTQNHLYSNCPPLVTLHARLELPSSLPLETLSQTLNCPTVSTQKTKGINDNYGLNILGKNLLSFYVHEYLVSRYPRLPLTILNAAVDAYISVGSLTSIGRAWGVETVEKSGFKDTILNEPAHYKLGKLRFINQETVPEPGITKIISESMAVREDHAYASVVRSLIGALYAHDSEETAKKFIYDHILSRKVDMEALFKFNQPTRELSRLCSKENLDPPVARLLAETGRLSAAPVFVVGVFSGLEKLGEGYGSSLAEAKIRASVVALKSYYLYQTPNYIVPSDSSFKGDLLIDSGDVIV